MVEGYITEFVKWKKESRLKKSVLGAEFRHVGMVDEGKWGVWILLCANVRSVGIMLHVGIIV